MAYLVLMNSTLHKDATGALEYSRLLPLNGPHNMLAWTNGAWSLPLVSLKPSQRILGMGLNIQLMDVVALVALRLEGRCLPPLASIRSLLDWLVYLPLCLPSVDQVVPALLILPSSKHTIQE